jgi:hypothetical protein
MRLPNPFRRPLLRFITTRIVKYDAMYHNLAHLIEQQQAQPKEN